MESQETYDFGSQELNTQDLGELVGLEVHASRQPQDDTAAAQLLEDDLTEYDGEEDEIEDDVLFGLQGVLEDLPSKGQQDAPLDPFTAAQFEESALLRQQSLLSQSRRGRSATVESKSGSPDSADNDDEDAFAGLDGSFAFTQKLLSNAKTLRELQASGAPEVEIAYEAEVQGSLQAATIPRLVPHGFAPPNISARRSSQFVQSAQLSQRSTGDASQEDYEPLTQERFYTFNALTDDALWPGRFERIPVRTLQELTFVQAKQCLHNTRVYRPIDNVPTFATCLRNLFEAKDESRASVFHILQQRGTTFLLQDEHSSPCTVLAHALYTGLEADNLDAIQLTHFFFDHAVSFGPPVREDRVPGGAAQPPRPGQGLAPFPSQSSGDDAIPPPFSFSPDDMFEPMSNAPTAVLMIVSGKRVSWDAMQQKSQAHATQRQQQASLFEVGRQLSAAEAFVDDIGEYSMEKTEHVDANDFPVDFVDE